ncbi:MAG: isoprenylcysteine carboxyl methyltransferase [Bacteriovoracaceae bacterium]|jgi:methyltransferase|nr:isoprenylcysteine carboxyl methyltransferase [Bacteriovoracaceae bacterium]
MMTNYFFYFVVAIFIGQRLVELACSRKNERALLAKGGVEYDSGSLIYMKLFHTLWFVGLIGESVLLSKVVRPQYILISLPFLVIGQFLRFLSVKALRERWTIKVIALPGVPSVKDGIYKYMKHPNYLGVVLEIFWLPFMGGAYVTSIVGTILNLFLLKRRVKVEEQALSGFDPSYEGRPQITFVDRSKAC